MILPDEGIEFLFKHSSSIMKIFHFDFNDKNHFLSLSEDGEIIEWLFNNETLKVSEIVKFHIKRPNNDLLSKNKHEIAELKSDEYYKITQVIEFENFITIGYSDGLILVYQVIKKENEDNNNIKKSNSKEFPDNEEQKNEEINNENEENQKEENEEKEEEKEENEENEENEEEKEEQEEEEDEKSSYSEEEEKSENESNSIYSNIDESSNKNKGKREKKKKKKIIEKSEEKKEKKEKKEEKKGKKKEEKREEKKEEDREIVKLEYFNYFNLYYVLLGHLKEISYLCYIPQIKLLVSSSYDQSVKIFDFETGHLKYYFKLDFIVNKILYQNLSKNKNSSIIILNLLSNEPVKVSIDLSKNPITFNNYYFKYNEIIQLEQINDKFYALNSKNVLILNKFLELEGSFISLNNELFKYFSKYKNDYLLVDNENYIRIVEFINKDKNKEDQKDKKKKNEKNKKQNPKGKNAAKEENEEKVYENMIITDCKFKVGVDSIKGFYIVDNFIFVYCIDGNIYLVDYNKIQENYERKLMAVEDMASLQLMMSLVNAKKPRKKGKSKKKNKKK